MNEAWGASAAVTLGMWHEKQLAPAWCWRFVSGVGMAAWSAAGSWHVWQVALKYSGPFWRNPSCGSWQVVHVIAADSWKHALAIIRSACEITLTPSEPPSSPNTARWAESGRPGR